MTGHIPNQDLANNNAYTKFAFIQDIERKQNYEWKSNINQGP